MKPPAVPTPVAFVLLATFALLNPVHDTDLFWQAHFGDLAIAQRGPVRTEPIYPDALGRPIVPIYGLAQVWYASVRKAGGWELVKLLDALVWAAAFVLPASFAQRRFDPSRSWPGAVAAVIACLAASKFYMTRPQTFAMLGFGTLLAILLSDRPTWRKLIAGFTVGVLWQNAHPSVVVGALAVTIYASVGWAMVWLKRGEKPWVATLLVPLLTATVFLSPAGVEILTVMRDNTERVRQFGVTEWLPLFHSANRGVNVPAVFGLVVTGVAMIVRWRRLDPRDAAVAIAFAALTVWSHRFVVFFALASVPVWVRAMTSESHLPTSHRPRSWLPTVIVASLFPLAYGLLLAGRLPLWNDWLPTDAVEFLRSKNARGTIFTETQWGGLLTDRGERTWAVSHDGRYFARSADECEWYLRAVRGDVPVSDIESTFRPSFFFLSSEMTGLQRRLIDDEHWVLMRQNERSVIFMRRND
jgi:hypothetical protein